MAEITKRFDKGDGVLRVRVRGRADDGGWRRLAVAVVAAAGSSIVPTTAAHR